VAFIFQLKTIPMALGAHASVTGRVSVAILIFILYLLWFRGTNINFTSVTHIVNTQCSCTPHSNVLRNMSHANEWKLIGHIYGEQVRLRNMSTIVAFRSKTIEDHVPTVPWLSVDSHLLVLGVGKSCTLQNQPHFYNGLNSRCKNRFIKRKIHCCQM
jgi:hypothetical protein